MTKNKNKYLIAVYGSLRSGLNNHQLIKSSNYVGTFDSEPVFSMYSLHSYPGLILNGSTSIKFEVYEVEKDVFKKVRGLEGYDENNKKSSHYLENTINTPWGNAIFYVYNRDIKDLPIVESGDWKDFVSLQISSYV